MRTTLDQVLFLATIIVGFGCCTALFGGVIGLATTLNAAGLQKGAVAGLQFGIGLGSLATIPAAFIIYFSPSLQE